uniref:C2H2-type domain-containing protein n=1 Tax=Oryza punctata TaxID=4537 RepID=A0A0E0K368_ORYPU
MAMVVAGSHRPPSPQSLRLVPPPPPQPPPPPLAYKHHCKVCKKGFMCGRALGGHMRAHGIGDDNDTMDDDDDDHSLSPCGDGGGEPSEAAGSPTTTTTTTTTKSMYALRTNPGRPRNCRTCENCGKEFTSWKTLLDHGRCGFDEEDARLDVSLIRSPPLHDGGDDNDGEDEEGDDLTLAAGGWSKGKRSRRAKVMAIGTGSVSELQLPAPSTEEEDLANFLVMLSSSSSSSSRVAQPAIVVDDADQESCASGSKDEERNRFFVPQPISIAAPMMAQMTVIAPQMVPQQHISTVPRGMFECKACKKVFTSHQALGGHRASHKKVKGCFAAKLESSRNETATEAQQQHVTAAPHDDTRATTSHVIPGDISMDGANTIGASADADGKAAAASVGAGEIVIAEAASTDMTAMMMPVEDLAPASLAPSGVLPFKKKGKVHECSICHRVFTSGQALGGHKRCHWLTSGATDPLTKLQPVAQDHAMVAAMCHQLTLGRPIFDAIDQRILDLNVPANPLAEAVAARQQQQVAAVNDGALSLNAAASVYLQSWTGHSNGSHVNKTTATGSRINDAAGGATTEDDEADSTSAKRAKIGDLKDMKVAGESLPWLQVGIGISSESKEKNTQE